MYIYIASGITVTITNLTLKNGKGFPDTGLGVHHYGGGIRNDGTMIIVNSTITDNISKYGAGIYNAGVATMNRVTIKNNGAEDEYSSGGGIKSGGITIIENSIISNNTVKDCGGGICRTGMMILRGVTVRDNTAKNGGGIWSGIGELTIENSTIMGNIATDDIGGGIANYDLLYVYGSKITYNMAKDGGGIFNAENKVSTAYIDDITVIESNRPNDFKGRPFIPS